MTLSDRYSTGHQLHGTCSPGKNKKISKRLCSSGSHQVSRCSSEDKNDERGGDGEQLVGSWVGPGERSGKELIPLSESSWLSDGGLSTASLAPA